ncbi:hypothetical protein BD309DRAFT_957108 [Dichomitus squalens]|nr:hypothetical protein BD309DRAFT_957108 [Dichomitus squalens]
MTEGLFLVRFSGKSRTHAISYCRCPTARRSSKPTALHSVCVTLAPSPPSIHLSLCF